MQMCDGMSGRNKSYDKVQGLRVPSLRETLSYTEWVPGHTFRQPMLLLPQPLLPASEEGVHWPREGT
jgi:hypothetical protein